MTLKKLNINKKLPEKIDIEKTFSEFVENYGGQCIEKLIPKNPDFKNADFIFREEKLIAELKCLKKNQLEDDNFHHKVEQVISKWVKRGKISGEQLKNWRLGNTLLSSELYTDIIKITRPLIEDALRKAKHQLSETKSYFHVPDYFCVVLVANDGNYALQNREMYWLIGNILSLSKFKDSCINGYVYFTVNLTSRIPDSNLDWTIWSPAYNGDNNEEL